MNQYVLGSLQSEPFATTEAVELTRRPGLTTLVMVLTDVVVFSLAMGAALFFALLSGHPVGFRTLLQSVIIIIATVLVVALNGLYPAVGTYRFLESKRLANCIGFVQVASVCILSAMYTNGYQVRTLCFFLFATVGATLGRSIVRNALCRKRWWGESILLIGCGSLMEEIADLLKHDQRLGLHAAAVYYDGGTEDCVHDLPVLPNYEAALAFARESKIRTAMIVIGAAERGSEADANHRYGAHFAKLISLPPIPPRRDEGSRSAILGGYVNIRVSQMLLMRSRRALKRTMDFVIVVTAGILLLPVMLLIALAIKLTSPGPLFFGHSRIGKANTEFKAWKFRTMVTNADVFLAERLANDAALRAEWERDQKLRKDPRVTRVGAFLRKYSLDELPQLWNVLRYEMSLVGPRPICRDEVIKYGDYFNDYARVRPGLTGLWQVSGRNEMTYEERVQLDTYYVNNWAFWLDLYIIFQTVKVVVSSHGAY